MSFDWNERPMRKWESLVEQKIREAIEEGEFDNLPGQGQPLNLDHNPYEEPSLRLAHSILHANGFAPDWIELRKDIDREVDAALKKLTRAGQAFVGEREQGASRAEQAWGQAVETFRRKASELNQRILTYNIKAPSPAFQRLQIDSEWEIERALKRAFEGRATSG